MKSKNVTLLKLIIKAIDSIISKIYLGGKKPKNKQKTTNKQRNTKNPQNKPNKLKQHKPELQEIQPFKIIYNQCIINHKQAF